MFLVMQNDAGKDIILKKIYDRNLREQVFFLSKTPQCAGFEKLYILSLGVFKRRLKIFSRTFLEIFWTV